jgi:hypothetical protein
VTEFAIFISFFMVFEQLQRRWMPLDNFDEGRQPLKRLKSLFS